MGTVLTIFSQKETQTPPATAMCKHSGRQGQLLGHAMLLLEIVKLAKNEFAKPRRKRKASDLETSWGKCFLREHLRSNQSGKFVAKVNTRRIPMKYSEGRIQSTSSFMYKLGKVEQMKQQKRTC